MPERPLPLAALLGRGARYTGEMTFDGRVRVDGTFVGRIHTEDVLEIGESGVIDGHIDAATLLVAGTAKGDIRVRESLVVYATGKLYGKVDAANLQVEPGARIRAELAVGVDSPPRIGAGG